MTLSIITINYNNAAGLEKTIKSVISQTCKRYEFIIIDGGSKDGSKDIIEKYQDQITYWVSEPDNGIYNAMNKGVKVAKGEYCIFMNSGDIFYSNNVIDDFFCKADFVSDIIEGDCCFDNSFYSMPSTITGVYMFSNALCHQSTFIKTMLLQNDPYHENYKIASDWMHMFKTLIIQNGTYQHIDIIVCDYDCSGISATNRNLGFIERERWLRENLPVRIYEDYMFFSNCKEFKISRKLSSELSDIGEDTLFEKTLLKIIKIVKWLHKFKETLRTAWKEK